MFILEFTRYCDIFSISSNILQVLPLSILKKIL